MRLKNYNTILFSLKADSEVRHKLRKEMYAEAVEMFEKTVSLDPHDELALYYCARQYAIGIVFSVAML